MARSGISVTIGLDFERIIAGDDALLTVHYSRRGKPGSATGELVLLATGRTPNTQDLGLAELGVGMNGPAIEVDEHMQTSLPGVYAIGDCIGGHMLAHVASYEAEVAVDNILGEARAAADYTVVPSLRLYYTRDRLGGLDGSAGQRTRHRLSGDALSDAGQRSARLALGEPEGQVRMICERNADGKWRAHSGRARILGARASELIAEAALAMQLGATGARPGDDDPCSSDGARGVDGGGHGTGRGRHSL